MRFANSSGTNGTYWLGVLVALCTCFSNAYCEAATAAGDSFTDSALTDTSWYDAENQRLIPIHVEIENPDTANRDSRWLPKPKRIAKRPASTAPATTPVVAGNGWFGSGLTGGGLFGWVLIFLIPVLAVAIVLYAITKADIRLHDGESVAASKKAASVNPQTIERIQHLPPELRRTDVNMRVEAERLMNEEQFDQAIILLFGHQLLMLDHGGYLRLARGKTNGRYVRETRGIHPDSSELLKATVSVFERSYFGGHEITRADFEELWQGNTQLERFVDSKQGIAA